MLAVNRKEVDKYGCINCGCNYLIIDNCYTMNQPGVTCKHCGLHFQVLGDDIKPSVLYGTGRKDDNGKEIMESAIKIPHPRKDIPKWHWKAPDDKPEDGEYFNSRGLGYDLAGFVKSKQAGERILQMVKEVLHKDEVESWLDFRESEPTWIQFKFQESEFNLDRLHDLIKEHGGVITKSILEECKI